MGIRVGRDRSDGPKISLIYLFHCNKRNMEGLFAIYYSHRVITLTAFFTVAAILATWLRHDRRLDTIPGINGYPLIGVGYKLPPGAPALLRQWAMEYGDVFKIRVG